jgi:galactose-1-phosphate uridylyltransferase
MSLAVPNGLTRLLDERIQACLELPFQVRGGAHRCEVDPLRGSSVLFNPARSQRPRGGDAGCPFCTGQTPPTLFFMEAVGDSGSEGLSGAAVRMGGAVVETEQATLEIVRLYVSELPPGEAPDPWQSIRLLMRQSHPGPWGAETPLVHPARPWLMRTFLNFVPVIADPASAANCFVLSVPPPFHDSDIGLLLKDMERGQPQGVVPAAVVEALVQSWVVLEAWAKSRGLTPVPFVNAGKSPASGQSLECFHSQFYALDRRDRPPLFRSLAERRRTACPVCEILQREELCVGTFGSIVVAVHPAPTRNLTFVVAPREEVADLAQLPSVADFATALSWAVRRYEQILGGVPAYVIAVRTGEEVGHLHAEVVPRSNVNVPGGFEETTGFVVTTRDPQAVAAGLRGPRK